LTTLPLPRFKRYPPNEAASSASSDPTPHIASPHDLVG
jgi:hypothetical protein